MKLVLNMLVRDEADIIEDCLRFYLSQGVDLIQVVDNGSVDGTTEVLERYQAMGCLELTRKPEHTLDLANWMNELSERARTKHLATLVLNTDADEFCFPKTGTLRSVLNCLSPRRTVFKFDRVNFVPSAEENERKSVLERMTLKDSSRINFIGNPLPGKVIHRPNEHLWLTTGNHFTVLRPNAPFIKTLPLRRRPPTIHSIEILHFPARSYAQFEAKIKRFGTALERYRKGKVSPNRVVSHMYKKYLAGELEEFYHSLRKRGDVEDTRLRDYMRELAKK